MEQATTILADEVQGLGLFVGEFKHNLDPKRRLTIPSVWRSQVGSPKSLFVLPDFHERCLNVFPAEAMRHKLARLRERSSLSDPKVARFASIVGASADLMSWDAQGRIRIKDKLLGFAGLTDQVVMVGALDKFQLWNPKALGAEAEIDQHKLFEVGQEIDFF